MCRQRGLGSDIADVQAHMTTDDSAQDAVIAQRMAQLQDERDSLHKQLEACAECCNLVS